MSTYPVGTVAVATFKGRENTRVFRTSDWWIAADAEGGTIHHSRCDLITDIRPLVVLDPADTRVSQFVKFWLPDGGRSFASVVAQLIEAQTKPPRIPEPGLWGVVEASYAGEKRERYIHTDRAASACWIGAETATGGYVLWAELDNPVLVRDGVTA